MYIRLFENPVDFNNTQTARSKRMEARQFENPSGSILLDNQQQGEENIDRFILAIEGGRYIRIENMESQTLPVDMAGREYDFTDKTKLPVNGIKPMIRSSF